MTNPPFKYTPPRYGGMSQADLYTNRDIQYAREPSTPNQFVILGNVPANARWKGRAVTWELQVNNLEEGLGRVRGALDSVIARVRGETSGSPLETRYVDSLGLPVVTRKSVSPAPNNTAPTAVSHREESSSSGTGTTATGTAPTGLADGDTMIAWVIHDDPTTTVSAVPTGWELLKELTSPSDFKAYMYTKIAASEGASWDWTLSASERWRVIVAAADNGKATGVSVYDGSMYRNATRFYLPNSGAAPSISPSVDAGWELTASAFARKISRTTKTGTGPGGIGGNRTSTSDHDQILRQYVAGPLSAQTISAQTVKLQIQGYEASANANQFVAWSVKAVDSTGALRGQIVALQRDGTEVTTTVTNRGDSATSTSVTVQDGDYLVFELGFGGAPSDASSYNTQLTFDDIAATDLPEDSSSTAAYSPWIEFASAITLTDVDAPASALSAQVTRAGSLIYSLSAVDVDAITHTGATDSGGTITEQLDSAAASISAALYSEAVSTVGSVTHTLTRSSGTTDRAIFIALVEPELVGTRISHVNLFGRHAIALSDANLIVESAETTPSLQQSNHAPGSPVNALVPIIVGGATAQQRVAVLRSTDPIQLLDDLSTSPTVNGTAMHADTEPAWGLVQTILVGTSAQPEKDIMIYADGAIRMMSRADAIGTQPTVGLSGVPNGGGLVGQLWIPGQPVRILGMFPDEDCGTSQAATVNVPMKPVFINLFGTDAQDLEVPLVATSNVTGRSYTNAWLWENRVILTDGPRLWEYDGTPRLMNWPGERSGVGADGVLLCRGGWVKANQMRILVERVALFGGTGNTLYWVEEYDENTGRFHQVSAVVDSGEVGAIVGADAVGSFPFSTRSEINYWYDDTQWAAQLYTDIARNPLYDFNGITGAGSQYGYEEEAAATSPEMVLPGLARIPSVITEIEYVGNPELGGDDAEVSILVADQGRTSLTLPSEGQGVSATFSEADKWDTYHKPFPDNTSAFDRLQYKVIGRRGTTASKSPQCVPFIIRGISFLDGRVEKPRVVLGADWLLRFQ